MANFSSPHADALDQIGDLTAIMVLGRLGLLHGPLVGAISFLLLGEVVAAIEYPDLIPGPRLLLVVIYVPGGVESLFEGCRYD